MKKCKLCCIEKRESEFNKRTCEKDGLNKSCRQCINARKRAFYALNPGPQISASRQYRSLNRERISVAGKARYEGNKNAIKASVKAWAEKNREKVRLNNKQWREANKSYVRMTQKKWHSLNPERVAENNRIRRARKFQAEGSHKAGDIRDILKKQKGLCAICREALNLSGRKRYHIDHVVPLILGGSNWPVNLQCLCPRCNLSKGDKDPFVWANENGRLL